MATRVVPLFPLNVVLFPGMILPLHVFEPRYRMMIQRCLESRQLFGVCLIREGEEVGEPAVPHPTGTLAAIQQVSHYTDGRMDLLTVGVSRFRLLESVEGEPYMQAVVQLLDDGVSYEDPPNTARVRELFRVYLDALKDMTAVPFDDSVDSLDAQQLSFNIAAVMPITLDEKQRLLEMPSPTERLAAEAAILERETGLVREVSGRSKQSGYFYFRGRKLSLN